jgi:succinate dehydrogenase / fumarate reductase iron-sulfur subunit
MNVKIRVPRYEANGAITPVFQTYTVAITPTTTVLDALNQIKGHQDGTLAFRRSCRSAMCGSCGVMVNGRNRLACNTRVAELNSSEVSVNPLPGFPVIRDLVVDWDPFFAKDAVMLPYLITDQPKPADGTERLQSPGDVKQIASAAACVQCGCCSSACPVQWSNSEYYGPAALTRSYRFVEDSRDTATKARLDIVGTETGVWRCHTIFNCTSDCPKGILNTENIQALKRKIMLSRLGLGRIEVRSRVPETA